jgi:hypothetical protein
LNKRIVITCLIILVCACLLLTIIVAAGTGIYYWDKSTPLLTITSAPTVEIHPKTTSSPVDRDLTPTIDVTPAVAPPMDPTLSTWPTTELPDAITIVMDQIQDEVVEIRGLNPNADIPRALLAPDELRQNVINDFLADYTPKAAKQDAISLSLFGLLPETFNLLTFYEDLYSEQIAGYYDNESKEMYVISGSEFGGPERMTYAHEFTHILQDQNYDFENGLKISDDYCEEDSERCAAASALIEGDASLTEYIWFYQYATSQDQADVQSFYQDFQSPVYESAPDFMKEDFLFPYSVGQEFVQVLYDQGGWQAVNNAYTNPPLSTEQIMHPRRYPDDTPIQVSLPDLSVTLSDGWEQIESDVVGEWFTYLMLAKGYQPEIQLEAETAREASEGWGGDTYHIYFNSINNQAALIIKTVWDTHRDAKEFFDAFEMYGETRWGSPSTQVPLSTWIMNLIRGMSEPGLVTTWQTNDQAVVIRYDTSTTIVIIAPDSNTRDTLLESIVEQ